MCRDHAEDPAFLPGISEMEVFLFCFVFLGTHPQHTKVPRLGIKLELQLPAYTTATATPDLSHIFDLHHSSQQHQILNPLRPGIKPTSLWILVWFVTAEPQWELLILI